MIEMRNQIIEEMRLESVDDWMTGKVRIQEMGW
jgi:hypothetical protein